MSQVVPMPSQTTLEDLVKNADHIVLVTNLQKNKVYREEILPKETHFQKKEETVYREYVTEYKVDEVLYSKNLKKGESFWVWRAPDYNFYLYKMMHEEGIQESPYSNFYESKFKVEGNQYILFLYNMENSLLKNTYENRDHENEGLEGLKAIKDLISKK